jgi:hypothetical protein
MSIREINEPIANRPPRRAVLYGRVSTKEQAQGYSILAQLELLRPYGEQNGFAIDQEFTDVETAKKPGRPGFNAMLRYLAKNPGCRVILVEKTDRLYRNLSDAGRVEEMGIEVHLVKPGQIISKASGAADKHRHGMDVLDAKRKAYEEGFRFRKSRGKVPVATLHKILRNRLYMGEFDFGGVRYQGSHEPLVARAVWDRVQEILDGRAKRKHRRSTHEFAYSGMVDCGHCGCSLVGEVKKQRYVYYHCTGYRGKCPEPYTREETLEAEFARHLQELALPPQILRWLEAELVESENAVRASEAQELKAQQAELDRLQRRQEVMYEDRLDGRIDAATYDRKVAEIRVQQEQIQRRIRDQEGARLRPASQGVDLSALVDRMAECFAEQSAGEQRKLLQLLVQKACWKNGALQTSLREPFEALRAQSGAANMQHPEPSNSELAPQKTTNIIEIPARDS